MSDITTISMHTVLKDYLEELKDSPKYPDLRKNATNKAIEKIVNAREDVHMHLVAGDSTQLTIASSVQVAFRGATVNYVGIDMGRRYFAISVIADALNVLPERVSRRDLDESEKLRIQEAIKNFANKDFAFFDAKSKTKRPLFRKETLSSVEKAISEMIELDRLTQDSWLFVDNLFDAYVDEDDEVQLCKVRDLNMVIGYLSDIAREYGVHVVIGFYSEDLPIEDSLEWYEPRAKIIEITLEEEPSLNGQGQFLQ